MPNYQETLTKLAKDLLYVGVGATVIQFQRAQVRRQEFNKAVAKLAQDVKDRLPNAKDQLKIGAQNVDKTLDNVSEAFEKLINPYEEKLPEPAKDLARKSRTQLKALRKQVLSSVA
jgi:DNA anti-recombination protein RmuC